MRLTKNGQMLSNLERKSYFGLRKPACLLRFFTGCSICLKDLRILLIMISSRSSSTEVSLIVIRLVGCDFSFFVSRTINEVRDFGGSGAYSGTGGTG